MYKIIILVLFTVTILLFNLNFVTCSTSSAKDKSDKISEASNRQRLSRAHLEFALELFRQLTSDTSAEENVILSPYSVASVLSQLWLGAGNGSETLVQLEKILRYSDSNLTPLQVLETFKSTLAALDEPEYKNMVQSANAAFVQAGVHVLPSYFKALAEYYNASLDEVDFEKNESVARSIINRWVAEQTKGQIGNLLQTPLPPNTSLLLVNAIALRALWNNSFDPSVTSTRGIFYLDSKTKKEIPMMQGKFSVLLGSSADLKCSLLELPFRGRRLSMFILLPNSQGGSDTFNSDEDNGSGETSADGGFYGTEDSLQRILQIERNLTAENLKLLFSTLKEETVQIRLPRFRVEQNVPLTGTLASMGLDNIFDISKSDFSQISDDSKVHVSAMSHRVVLEVSEEGASASAASSTFIQRLWKLGEKFFEVNRPFIFFIWDYHNGALLFIGRVVNPEPLLS